MHSSNSKMEPSRAEKPGPAALRVEGLMHFSGPILLGRSKERRFFCAVASREVAVEYDVVLGHTPSGESSHEFRSHSLTRQLIQVRNGGHGAGMHDSKAGPSASSKTRPGRAVP